MKKFYLTLSIISLSLSAFATQFSITTPGFFYQPQVTNAAVGDTINFQASGTHPCVEVSQSTWMNNDNTPLAGGFGFHNSNFSIVISAPGTIYFVCDNHASSGMKGQIVATASNVAEVIGSNAVSLLSSSITSNFATVLNTTGVNGTLEIFDMSGKRVDLIPVTSEVRQQVPVELQKGIFLYRFIMEGVKPTETARLFVGTDVR